MRISSFFSYVLWFIALVVIFYLSFTYEYVHEPMAGRGVFETFKSMMSPIGSVLSAFCLIMQSIILTDDLRGIVVFQYKIVEEEYKVSAKYMTSFWLFIPYWKSVDTNSHSCKSQNMFGAKRKDYYETDVSYSKKEEALKAIEDHKKGVERSKGRFFERPEEEESKTTYL